MDDRKRLIDLADRWEGIANDAAGSPRDGCDEVMADGFARGLRTAAEELRAAALALEGMEGRAEPRGEVSGWAVANDGAILIRTVSDTRRAALVNWLCTEGGWMALWNSTDAEIERAWRNRRGVAEVVPVTVLPATEGSGLPTHREAQSNE